MGIVEPEMAHFDAAVFSAAQRLRLCAPVSVMLDYSYSSVNVGYAFSSRRPKGIICIKLGAMIAILNNCELAAVVGHELAHIQLGHTKMVAGDLVWNWMLDW